MAEIIIKIGNLVESTATLVQAVLTNSLSKDKWLEIKDPELNRLARLAIKAEQNWEKDIFSGENDTESLKLLNEADKAAFDYADSKGYDRYRTM